jgi:hypothetical protein
MSLPLTAFDQDRTIERSSRVLSRSEENKAGLEQKRALRREFRRGWKEPTSPKLLISEGDQDTSTFSVKQPREWTIRGNITRNGGRKGHLICSETSAHALHSRIAPAHIGLGGPEFLPPASRQSISSFYASQAKHSANGRIPSFAWPEVRDSATLPIVQCVTPTRGNRPVI